MKGQVVDVESYSAFGSEFEDTKLAEALRQCNVGTVFSVGLAFDYCVGSTAESAALAGFQSYLIEDASRSTPNPDNINDMKERLEKAGVRVI